MSSFVCVLASCGQTSSILQQTELCVQRPEISSGLVCSYPELSEGFLLDGS